MVFAYVYVVLSVFSSTPKKLRYAFVKAMRAMYASCVGAMMVRSSANAVAHMSTVSAPVPIVVWCYNLT